jgi:hypothetical protein
MHGEGGEPCHRSGVASRCGVTGNGLSLANGHRAPTARETMVAALRRVSLPLASYYGVTVVVQLVNGAGNTGRAFLEHMTFVLLAPLALVVLAALVGHLGRKGARKMGELARERC